MYSHAMVKKIIIDANTLISDLLDSYPKTAAVLINKNMACVGCEAEEFHALKDVTQNYNIEIISLLEEIENSTND